MYYLFCLIRSLLHLAWMAVTMPIYAILILILSPFASKALLYRIARGWLANVVWSLRWICGVQWRITGLEHLQSGQTPVILAKHQSTYETFLLPAILPRPIAYVYKRELNYVPLFGWAMSRLDMVHINRSAKREAFNLVADQGRRIMGQGVSVAMFPEGTRIPRGQAGQYKTGGSRLAVATGQPLVPIAITSAKCWPRKAIIKYPGVVDVSIGAPIASAGRDVDELMAEAKAFIEGEMRRLDGEAYE